MGRTAVLNQTLRDERKEQRLQDRKALLFEYNQYRNEQRAVCKGITAKGREDRQQALARLDVYKRQPRDPAERTKRNAKTQTSKGHNDKNSGAHHR